jgi:hypothetical protein
VPLCLLTVRGRSRWGGEPVLARARTRGGAGRGFHQATIVAKVAATIAATLRGLNPVGYAGRSSTARMRSSRKLPHQKDDHARAGRGGVAGGALPMSAGTSFHGGRKPNGSACQRCTMAAVQAEAKHAMSPMSPLKFCEVEKPHPQREIPNNRGSRRSCESTGDVGRSKAVRRSRSLTSHNSRVSRTLTSAGSSR